MDTKKMMEIVKDMKVDRLHKRVLNEIVEDAKGYSGKPYERVMKRLKDILYGGLSTGIVGSLIYYSDTTHFFDLYRKDIMKVLKDWNDGAGQSLGYYLEHINGWDCDDVLIEEANNKNLLAWRAYEIIAYNLQAALEE